MKIAIVSDTHSRYANVQSALDAVKKRGVTTVLHCGDIEDGATVRLFAGLHAHFVFGNCDHDKEDLRRAMAEIGAKSHEQWGHLEIDGRKLAFMHGDDKSLMHEVEASGQFDYLFHGHTHVAAERRTGTTRIINPGALHRAKPKTFIVLDLASGAIESISISTSEESSR